jgi:CDGSH-type Zn-finger protein/uncharacterized Fe-S cluster protein YjdI
MKKKIYQYSSEEIEVSYDLVRCIHAEECVHGLPQVFNPKKRPWIEPNQASADELADVIMRCPTGALHFERADGGFVELVPDENTITIVPDGPLYLRGEIEIIEPEGTFRDTRVALCRCGLSKNKPLCDNSHLKGFQADGKLAKEKMGSETWVNGGVLKVIPSQNGPFEIRGNFQIRGVEGGAKFLGNQEWLCRCGGSGNKPFCDGTHRKIGFSSEG